jgi:hypothetical protein
VKVLTSLLTAALLLFSASSLFAQNNLPDPNDNACWQSLETVHKCAQADYDRAMSQALRCTSYPEYQCEPESQPVKNTPVAKAQKQKKSKVASASAAQSHQTGNGSGSDAVVVDLNSADSLR